MDGKIDVRRENKTIEGRMNKMKNFEKIIKNSATTGLCNVTSESRTKATALVIALRDAKKNNNLGIVFFGENKAASEVKIRSFTRGSGSTISGKIYENSSAIIIDTGAEVSTVRKGLVRVEDVEPVTEMIRLKTVTGESTPITSEASVEICIGQLRIRHWALVASMEDGFILEIDLIRCHGLTIDLVKDVLRLGNEEFKLNQRCIEAKPAR